MEPVLHAEALLAHEQIPLPLSSPQHLHVCPNHVLWRTHVPRAHERPCLAIVQCYLAPKGHPEAVGFDVVAAESAPLALATCPLYAVHPPHVHGALA